MTLWFVTFNENSRSWRLYYCCSSVTITTLFFCTTILSDVCVWNTCLHTVPPRTPANARVITRDRTQQLQQHRITLRRRVRESGPVVDVGTGEVESDVSTATCTWQCMQIIIMMIVIIIFLNQHNNNTIIIIIALSPGSHGHPPPHPKLIFFR